MNKTLDRFDYVEKYFPNYFALNKRHIIVSLIEKDLNRGIIQYSVYNYVRKIKHVISIDVIRERYSVHFEWAGCRFPKLENQSYYDIFGVIKNLINVLN